MRILHSKKLIFISKPRCGSTSLRKLLDSISQPGDLCVDYAGQVNGLHPHMTIQSIANYLASNNLSINDYFVFTVARNPFDMLWSYFKYFKPDRFGRYNYNKDHDGKRLLDFNDWLSFGKVGIVKNFNPAFPGFITSDNLSPLSLDAHVCDSFGNILTERIFKIEEPVEIINWLKSIYGIEGLVLPSINKSDDKELPRIPEDVMIQLRKQLPLDFALYNLP